MSNRNCIIIAEAGVNHNGSMDLAHKLIDVAADAGVNYIKFQTFRSELNLSVSAKKANYQIANTQNKNESQLEMVKKLELSFDQFLELKEYCTKKNIGFLSTGFDIPSVEFLSELDMPYFKIPSGEITNKPYLQHIARKGKPVILSTGMSTMGEIGNALNLMIDEGTSREQITLLHCNTDYPTSMQDVNLKAMLTIHNAFNVSVGYSDHTLGIEVPIAAVALGATVIEKHFTLDRNMPGPDHKASLEPSELKEMVKAIRNIELAMSGNGKKEPSRSELPNIPVARKSIHFARNLVKGHILIKEDFVMKRPGNGISPMEYEIFIGKTILYDVAEDQLMKREDIN